MIVRKYAILFLLTVIGGGVCRAELMAAFESGGERDVRTDRLPALRVEAGESATPFLPAGEFGVVWSGKLLLSERRRLVFSFEGEGGAVLEIGGRSVHSEEGVFGTTASESIRLNRGEHDLSITYRSKQDGTGSFRLFWEEPSFPRQSVPPTAFQSEGAEDPARHGRRLFAQHHCAKCHGGVAGMTELGETGPLLLGSGSRLREAWTAAWIASPASFRPHARMPDLIDESTAEGRQQAADIAAWLMTQTTGETPPAPDPTLASVGGADFHRLGCAACHTAPGATADPQRISLDHVAFKFQPGALAAYLKKPDAWYPHTGMPDFALSDAEAAGISAWLLEASGKAEPVAVTLPAGDPTRGMAAATALHCAACHAGTGTPPSGMLTAEAIFARDWAAVGCVSPTPGPGVPRFAFTEDERASLVAFSRRGTASLTRHVPAEYAAGKMAELRCTSCHGIDGQPSLLDRVHVDTLALLPPGEGARLDQSRPHLTFAGEMLHATYLEGMLKGSPPGGRPRPWLEMRMPAFHGYAHDLAHGIARLHGVEPGGPQEPPVDRGLAEVGQKLVSSTDGFGCITCHGAEGAGPTAAFEVEGINFSLVPHRLRHEWFTRWMDNPLSVTPGSKMPRYTEGGKSPRAELGGDASKQFEAIWNYLQSLER